MQNVNLTLSLGKFALHPLILIYTRLKFSLAEIWKNFKERKSAAIKSPTGQSTRAHSSRQVLDSGRGIFLVLEIYLEIARCHKK